MQKKNKHRLFYYLLILYVVLAYGWWSYLLYSKNDDVREAKVELIMTEMKYNKGMSEDAILESMAYSDVQNYYNSQESMIIAEGIVFFILLLVGMWLLNRGFRKEVALARQQRNFLLSITHELKSPIASIRLAFDTFLKRKETLRPDQIGRLSQNAIKETERLHNLVNNILLAARIESSFQLFKGEVQLNELFTMVINGLREKYPNTRFAYENNTTIPVIQADRLALTSVILNLLENAVKYCPKETEIRVRLNQKGNNIVFEVIDQGDGIVDEEKEHVFEKFYRVGNEDTRRTKGTGLGLFIVKSIIMEHKGRILVKDNEPKGAIFEVTLPIN